MRNQPFFSSLLIFSSLFAGANPSQQSASKNVQYMTECSRTYCQQLPINFINPNLISSIVTLPIIKADYFAFDGYANDFAWFRPWGSTKSNFFASNSSDNGFHHGIKTIGLKNHSSKNLEVEISFQRSITSPVEFLAKITIQPTTTDFVYLKETIYVHRVFYRFSEPVDYHIFGLLYKL